MLSELGYPPFANDSLAIRVAIQRGLLNSVRMLLEDGRADPGIQNNVCLMIACYNGHTEIVRLLLADPRVDPTTRERAHIDVLVLLLADWRLADRVL